MPQCLLHRYCGAPSFIVTHGGRLFGMETGQGRREERTPPFFQTAVKRG